jgi:hypothetical protein
MEINEKILKLQAHVKVGKTEYNDFSGYYYRNAEGILKEIKPILQREGLILTMTETLHQFGNEIAVESKVKVVYNGESQEVSAWAVVDLAKKGMDKAQATGAAISYARKYALCGLLLLDDGQDNDAQFSESNIKNALKKAESLDELTKMWDKLTKSQKEKVKPAFSARWNELNTNLKK